MNLKYSGPADSQSGYDTVMNPELLNGLLILNAGCSGLENYIYRKD